MEEKVFKILSQLEKNGFEAYIVGGYVRDKLRNKFTNDVDICTNARPKDIMQIFNEYHPIPYEYGNVVLEFSNFKCEITTFRKDIIYSNNRKPDSIEYIDKLEEDILRRDFTVNAICMDKDGKIIDLLNGQADLKKKRLKVIGDADTRLKEDCLRIMRAVRFATILNLKLDDELKQAIINNRSLLKKLSFDRKKEELSKIFMSENKKYGIKLLKELKLVDMLDLVNIDNVLYTSDPIGIWSTITLDNTYTFTKSEKKLIKSINELMHEDLTNDLVLYKYGLYIASIVCDLKKINKKKITKIYDKLPIKDKNEIKITAEDICELLNVEPDVFLKDMFDDIEKAILERRVKNNLDDLKNYILAKYV